MATYLLTWNPARFEWTTLHDDIAQLRAQGWCPARWSCGSTQRIQPGDRVFLMRLGEEPRGIMASGTARSVPYESEHWDPHSESALALYVDLDLDLLIDPDSHPEAMLDWETLKTEVPQAHNWTPQASGVSIPDLVAAELEELWAERTADRSPTSFDADYFVQGRVYRRLDLHQRYGGQQQGGISTPADHNLIFLFTGETGQPYGYQDQWTDDGLFLYTGEGQQGDMTFVRGNRAVRDHVADGKDLHLYEYVRSGYVRYLGQMICTGHHERESPDIEGHSRRAIVFELAPIDGFIAEEAEPADQEPGQQPLTVLRERAMASSTYAATPRERLIQAHERSQAVRTYVFARAHGHCEACGQPAPFRTGTGRPYLEGHHIRSLSDAGPDDPHWVIALCPNCHRRAHHSVSKAQFNDRLTRIVRDKETEVSAT
jgi:5-methylcytosine-specific restriction protein A